MNFAIMVCGEVTKRCTANGCFKALNNKADAFQGYNNEMKLVSYNTCSGCEDGIQNLHEMIKKFKKASVDTVHLSTCIRGRCDNYQEFAKILSQDFDVIGYTHGSESGKKNNTLNVKRSMI